MKYKYYVIMEHNEDNSCALYDLLRVHPDGVHYEYYRNDYEDKSWQPGATRNRYDKPDFRIKKKLYNTKDHQCKLITKSFVLKNINVVRGSEFKEMVNEIILRKSKLGKQIL